MWTERSFDRLPFLIAEDSADDLRLLEGALRAARIPNPRLITCTDVETIQLLENVSRPGREDSFPVVLFLDLLMPHVSGLEVLKWLVTHSHPPLPVVLHTGTEDDGLLERARRFGASYYLPKGARPDALKEVFRRARLEHEGLLDVLYAHS